jgi:hypothetical protein
MTNPITIVYTVVDGKGRVSTPAFYLDGNAPFSDVGPAALAYIKDVQAVLGGQVIGGNLTIPLDLTGVGSGTPVATSDVEEGALFIMRSANNFTTRQRLPTFAESRIVTGGDDVDLGNLDVSVLVNNLTLGIDSSREGGTGVVRMTDVRGDLITAVSSAKKSFQNR